MSEKTRVPGAPDRIVRPPIADAPGPSPEAAGVRPEALARVAANGGAGASAGASDARGTPTRGLPPGAMGAAVLRGLQGTAGNRAATGLVVQRAQRDPAVVQRDNGEARQPPLLSATALRRSEAIRGVAQARLVGVAGYNAIADRAIATYRDKRLIYAGNWGRAWERHSAILTQAGEQAAMQNLIEGVVIGAVASVLVAAAATVVFPAAAAAAAFSAGWMAFTAGTATAASVLGTGAAVTIGRPSVPGATSGQRDAEADAWRAIANVESTARHVAACAPKFGLELGNAEYSIAQVQAHIDGGTTDMTWADTLDLVSTLANWETGLGNFDTQLGRARTGMESFEAAINEWEPPGVDRLEREVWYAWMAQLEDDEVLDQDKIQKELVRLGLIPDYFYMSDADQARAVASARRHVANASQPPGTVPR